MINIHIGTMKRHFVLILMLSADVGVITASSLTQSPMGAALYPFPSPPGGRGRVEGAEVGGAPARDANRTPRTWAEASSRWASSMVHHSCIIITPRRRHETCSDHRARRRRHRRVIGNAAFPVVASRSSGLQRVRLVHRERQEFCHRVRNSVSDRSEVRQFDAQVWRR